MAKSIPWTRDDRARHGPAPENRAIGPPHRDNERASHRLRGCGRPWNHCGSAAASSDGRRCPSWSARRRAAREGEHPEGVHGRRGFTLETGLSDATDEEAQMKRLIVASAAKSWRSSTTRSGAGSVLDLLLTDRLTRRDDDDAPAAWQTSCASAGRRSRGSGAREDVCAGHPTAIGLHGTGPRHEQGKPMTAIEGATVKLDLLLSHSSVCRNGSAPPGACGRLAGPAAARSTGSSARMGRQEHCREVLAGIHQPMRPIVLEASRC